MRLNFRRIWQVSLILAMLVLVAGIAFDSSDVDRYADKMEALMADGRYQDALEVGARSDKTSSRLQLLRIQALEHEHQLGERLFAYPVKRPSGSMARQGGDQELCAFLIDKKLDRFAAALPKYYSSLDNLPRYYREALVLYNHLRSNPVVVYHDTVLDTDYSDMQELERRYPDRRARHMAVFQQYEDTYWYYYEYL